jgi:hypothetical protein
MAKGACEHLHRLSCQLRRHRRAAVGNVAQAAQVPFAHVRMMNEKVDHGRDQQRGADALALHHLKRDIGLEAGDDHMRPPEPGDEVAGGAIGDVKHRAGVQIHLALPPGHAGQNMISIGEQVGM